MEVRKTKENRKKIEKKKKKRKIGGFFEYCGLQFSDSHDNNHLPKSANLSKANLSNIIVVKNIM